MIECGSLEYAQARLQSRHGQRATEAQWQQLESTREFGALLDTARAGPLRPWVAGITPQTSSQDIETVLRAHWHAAVAEILGWMPSAWHRALAWCFRSTTRRSRHGRKPVSCSTPTACTQRFLYHATITSMPLVVPSCSNSQPTAMPLKPTA